MLQAIGVENITDFIIKHLHNLLKISVGVTDYYKITIELFFFE